MAADGTGIIDSESRSGRISVLELCLFREKLILEFSVFAHSKATTQPFLCFKWNTGLQGGKAAGDHRNWALPDPSMIMVRIPALVCATWGESAA